MAMGDKGREISLAIIGLGGRGCGQMQTLLSMPDVRVRAVCDLYEDRVQKGLDICEKAQGFVPFSTTDYKEAISREDVEAVVVMTGWETHTMIANFSMRAGKRVAMEVGGASSVEECFSLVQTSDETGVPCMLLENCCYNDVEMTLLEMVRKGVFGEIVHCAGGYLHDLRAGIGKGDTRRHYRLRHFLNRNGELYPTHELGPIAKYLNINRGNRMVSLVSMASKAAGLSEWLKANRPDSPLCNAKVNQGDIVTTLIQCANGETIQLTHSCTLPRPYSRGGQIMGTKGIWMEDKRALYIEDDPKAPEEDTYTEEGWTPDEACMAQYKPALWREYERFGLRGGHGGMDYLCLRAFVESVQNGTNPPIDVYDAATWMAVTPLSEQSIALGSAPVAFPDFTGGRWLARTDKAEGDYALD